MNTTALQRFRATLAAGQTAYGLWVTLESPSITEMGVALGLDWIVIDAEHGHLDWKEIVEHVRETVRPSWRVAVTPTSASNGHKRGVSVQATQSSPEVPASKRNRTKHKPVDSY